MTGDELQTARLLLRRWQPQDEAAMAAINQDPDVTRYLNRPVDAAATAAFFALVQEHWDQHRFGFYALESREPASTGQLIGFAGVAYPTFLPELATRPSWAGDWRATPGGAGWRPKRHRPPATTRSTRSACPSSSRSSTPTTPARSASPQSSA